MNKKILVSEQGMALPLVLIISVCIILLAFGFVFLFQSRARLNNLFVNRNSAGYYAEAGVDQYIWNLNQDDHYYATHHIVASTFEAGYYYVEETDPTEADPTVTLKSTGWLAKDPDNKETIQVKLRKRQFTEYVYCTDVETAPPPDGSVVYWYSTDEMHSRLHTNGKLNFYGTPRFDDTVTFSGVTTYTANNFYNGMNYSKPYFYKDGVLSNWQTQCYYANALTPKGSNSELITLAQLNGYYFPHRTSIYLHDSNETPPHTLMDVYYWDGTQFQYKPNQPLPANGVIYVDGSGDYAGVPSGSQWQSFGQSYTSMMNAINNNKVPLELDAFKPDRGNVFISGKLRGRLTVAAANTIYICSEDPTHPYNSATVPSQPGLIYGSTTFNADGSYSNLGTDDMLGLCANNFIFILHNFWPAYSAAPYCDTSTYDIAPNEIYIQSALYAMPLGAFEYQDYWMDGLKGHINLVGSISQHYRGVRGYIGSTGYSANYSHDQRMDYETPPHFLSPLNAGWGIVTWTKLPPSSYAAYKPIMQISEIYADGRATSVSKGTNIQMHATISPGDATIAQGSSDPTIPRGLLWTVKNDSTASANIDSNTGLLTAGTTPGKVTVTAQAEDTQPGEATVQYSVDITITITQVVKIDVYDSGGIGHCSTTMWANNSSPGLTLYATITPTDADIKTLNWAVDNPALVNIAPSADTSSATLRTLSLTTNTATVHVTAAATDGSGVTCIPVYTVTINQQVTGISIVSDTGSYSIAHVHNGTQNTLKLDATVQPAYANNKHITWQYQNHGGANASISSSTDNYCIVSGGTSGGNGHYVNIWASANDGSGYVSTPQVTINIT